MYSGLGSKFLQRNNVENLFPNRFHLNRVFKTENLHTNLYVYKYVDRDVYTIVQKFIIKRFYFAESRKLKIKEGESIIRWVGGENPGYD